MHKKNKIILISSIFIVLCAFVLCSMMFGNKLGIGISNASALNSISASDDSYNFTLTKQSEWKEAEKYGYVYEIRIENKTDSTLKNWTCGINLGNGSEFVQGWCGKFSTNGDTVGITSLDYNSSIQKKSSITCGFIVKYSSKHNTEDMSFTIDKSNDNTPAIPDNTAKPADNNSTPLPVQPTDNINTPAPAEPNDNQNNNDNVSVGFKISGTKLLDAKGNEFVIRGINHAHAWYKEYLETAIPAIAATNANTVRVVLGDGQQWTKDDISSVKNIINICKKNKLITILEVHDATGSDNTDSLNKAADYWIEIKDALVGNEAYVIINIANEWYGQWDGKAWADGYKSVIPKIRKAGIKNTLMVDSAGWGQFPESIKSYGKSVLLSDSLANTMFSIHMYEYAGSDASTIKSNIDGAYDQGLCVCIGEFGHKHTNGDVDEKYIMEYCTKLNIGYIGWSWKGNGGGVEYLDIANSWDGSELSSDWGDVLINSTYGIKKNSKPCSVY